MADIFESVEALREAILAIEKELGINPKKIYSNVRARLDILENRINNPSTPSPSTDNPFFIGTSGITISADSGEPIASESAGSLYLRSDGDVFDGIYQMRGSTWTNISNYYESFKLNSSEDSGAEMDLRLSNGNRLSFNDNYSYLVYLKMLVTTTSGTITRCYFENKVLLNKDSGTLSIDDNSETFEILNGTGFTRVISVVSNELSIKVPASGSDNRKAFCIAEVQKLENF